ncbi:hypothetical protein [Lewinella cohaerens]|uniref:hypothetical protein n=1 Tax=Lewinella cohaerens TaxID=70995 RepID=UPI000368D4C6|nr:hypothetical protein [Lewinella cohaerens]
MRFLYIMMLVLTMQSCYTSKVTSIKDLSKGSLEIPLTVNSLTITDNRDSISTKFDFHIPFFTSYNHHKRKYTPPHDLAHKEIISAMVAEVFIGNEALAPVDVIVEIKEGSIEKYSLSGSVIEEWATIELEVEIIASLGKVSSTLTYLEIIKMWNGAGAKKDIKNRVEELYLITLRNTTYSTLNHLKKYMTEEGFLR